VKTTSDLLKKQNTLVQITLSFWKTNNKKVGEGISRKKLSLLGSQFVVWLYLQQKRIQIERQGKRTILTILQSLHPPSPHTRLQQIRLLHPQRRVLDISIF